MIQYTTQRIAQLREKLARNSAVLQTLDAAIDPVRKHYRIPDTGIASWGGFYACPKHSVTLEFDIANPHQYRCPVDGEMLTGEPYESAWWRHLNSANENACRMAALRYMLLGDADDLSLARNILVDYAKRYPNYEVHGDIPYNKPGKANAQTLCDAQWLKHLAAGYDIIREALPEADRALIERDLFRCGATFLMAHRTDQIHNHECIVNSCIGILGILLEDDAYVDFALHTRYGFLYHLEHALLRDGLWFEGTPSYHFYAMRQFIDFERFVPAGSPLSFFERPGFAEALKFPMRLMQPDGRLPPLNDAGNNDRGFAGADYLYELAFARTGDVDFARMLRLMPEQDRQQSAFSFFDGVETLPDVPPLTAAPYHGGRPGDSGITTMVGQDGRFLLVKHSPFGGEHDHYDRLGIHFSGFSKLLAPDIGTSQYGAPLHYAYYKNTPSHNTVSLGGQNQPPANCTVRSFTQERGITVLDTEVRWDGSYVPLDSLTIPQWSDEAYAGAVFRRHITWYGDFFVDCFDVQTEAPRTIDWMLHVRGARMDTEDTYPCAQPLYAEGAGTYLHDATLRHVDAPIAVTTWQAGDGICLQAHALIAQGTAMHYALGPDNPSVSDLSYLVERVKGTRARFVHVICAYAEGKPVLSSVEAIDCGLRIVREDGTITIYKVPDMARSEVQKHG